MNCAALILGLLLLTDTFYSAHAGPSIPPTPSASPLPAGVYINGSCYGQGRQNSGRQNGRSRNGGCRAGASPRPSARPVPRPRST